MRVHFELQVVKGAAGLVGDVLTFKWASATMAQAAVNTVVVAEVTANPKVIGQLIICFLQIACWFFIGECIGKGSLVGYQV